MEIKPININLPRHNVDIITANLAITYSGGKPREDKVFFLIPSRDGELKKDKNGFGYFAITIGPEKLYCVKALDCSSNHEYNGLNGDDLSKHIKQGSKQDKRDYN